MNYEGQGRNELRGSKQIMQLREYKRNYIIFIKHYIYTLQIKKNKKKKINGLFIQIKKKQKKEN